MQKTYLGTQEQASGAGQLAQGTRGNGSFALVGLGCRQGRHVDPEQLKQQQARALVRRPGTLTRSRIRGVSACQRGSYLRTQRE